MAATLGDWLRLARLPLAPTAITNALVAGWLTFHLAGEAAPAWPWWAWFALAGTSLGLYVAGMVLNDVADRARDATLNPGRPIPSGRIAPRTAVGVAALAALGAALLAALVLEAPHGFLVAFAGLCLYDLQLKRFPVPGSLAMGVVRFGNAGLLPLSGVLAGWAPVSALVAPLLVGVYATAVTLLSTTEEGDVPARRVGTRVLTCVAFAGAATFSCLAAGRFTLGVVLAAGVVTSTAFGRRPRAGSVKRQVLEMLLALYWLDYVLLTGVGWLPVDAGGLVLALALGIASQLAIRALRPRPPSAAVG